MQVIEYLNEHGPAKLTEEFAIKVKVYEEGLLVLNYDQIDSPKAHPIVVECRGLILDSDYNVVSRSFDRFFNQGEQPDTQAHIDMSKAVLFDKVDGSLIKLYHWAGKWRLSTRGSAFAEGNCQFGESFQELCMRALQCAEQEFQDRCDENLDTDWTYIFELTCAENRIVKAYNGYTLHYLAARNNKTYEYGSDWHEQQSLKVGGYSIGKYTFASMEDCLEVCKHLKDLDEGYVLYQDGRPVCKIKSPTYVAVHHIRGAGLSPKRICLLVLSGEHEEYLNYFRDDEKFFTPYVEALAHLNITMEGIYESAKNIESQKDFALAVKDFNYSGILFQARKNGWTVAQSFKVQSESYLVKLLEDETTRRHGCVLAPSAVED